MLFRSAPPSPADDPTRRSVWTYHGKPVPRSQSFRYLGIDLHETKGLALATDRLRKSATNATWAMHARCQRIGVGDFAFRSRLFSLFVEPIVTYCSGVWSPDLMTTLHDATHNPLQTVQSDYLRHLGRLRRTTPTTILSKETGSKPLATAWIKACTHAWNRAVTLRDCPLKRAFADDLALTHELARARRGGLACALAERTRSADARKTWSGAWLHVLWWLSQAPGDAPAALRTYLDTVIATAAQGADAIVGMSACLKTSTVLAAWEAAWEESWCRLADRRDTAEHEYAQSFQRTDGSLPPYFSDTARYRRRDCARALMRLRCCSAPFAACATTRRMHPDKPTRCTCCQMRKPETAHHIFYECPAFASCRDDDRYRPLFAALPTGADVRPLADHPNQFLVAQFTHAVFEKYDALRPTPPDG